jgi:hypothetical protein
MQGRHTSQRAAGAFFGDCAESVGYCLPYRIRGCSEVLGESGPRQPRSGNTRHKVMSYLAAEPLSAAVAAVDASVLHHFSASVVFCSCSPLQSDTTLRFSSVTALLTAAASWPSTVTASVLLRYEMVPLRSLDPSSAKGINPVVRTVKSPPEERSWTEATSS